MRVESVRDSSRECSENGLEHSNTSHDANGSRLKRSLLLETVGHHERRAAMKHVLKTVAVAVVAGISFCGLDYFLNAYRSQLLPKNFAVVTPGVLCRSGQMRPEHFAEMLREEGIRTVVCLNPGDGAYEQGIARGMGVDYVELHMPGDGKGEPALFHEYLEIVGDPVRRPVLVHCAAGAYRTGVAVALYRMLFEGWPSEDAMREMAYYGCKIHGDQPLIDHLKKTYESIPPELVQRHTLAEKQEAFERK